ncbi:MAG TPA: mechanosensitive ion channel domain-containing protein [Luteimonas sp.]|nr:mechanosensitive ion channel domain-containing protein [Luteimonas sp.]
MLPIRRVLPSILLFACVLALAPSAIAAPPGADAPTGSAAAPTSAKDTPRDTAATRQLQARLTTDQDLKEVTASVDEGVAELDGTVLQAAHKAEAGEIATKTPGVAAVVNNVEVDDSLGSHFASAWSQVVARLAGVAAKAPLLLVALVIVLFAAWLGGVLSRNLGLLRLRTDNPYMDGLFRRTIRVLVTLVGVVLALNLLGLSSLMGAVLGSAGVVGLALGFAFKDIAENYIAGVLLSVRKPFSPGEQIRIDAYEGKVVALTSRATILMTMDGNQLQLPNALVFKSVLLNFSQNPKRRFDFRATIDGSHSIRQAQTLALEAYAGIDGVLDDPAPSWTVVQNAPTGIELQFFGWVDQRASDLGKVRSEAIRLTKAAYARAGIQSPRTVQHVVISREPDAAPRATPAEPAHSGAVDTSVNRDIDDQLAQAQRAGAARNMLDADDGSEAVPGKEGTP